MSEGTAEEQTVVSEAVVSAAAEMPEIVEAAAIEQQELANPDQAETQANPAAQETSEALHETPAIDEAAGEQEDAAAEEAHPSTSSSQHVEHAVTKDEPTEAHTTVKEEEEDTDFVPPDMEHIVSTGATQDSASSMQALRDLVAQARASSGQPREALPPGFGDEESEASTSTPAQTQRGEKRKAEDELENLVRSSAGIDEVKAAAEKSQHPETKTLLQKALSSISGLVSRRGKAEAVATSSDKNSTQDDVKPAVDAEAADASDDSGDSASSSSDSSDDEDEDEDDKESKTALAGDDYDDEEGGGDTAAPATKNEILAPEFEQPAIQQVTDAEKQTLRKLGKVHSIVDSVVVVEQDVQQSQTTEGSSANAAPVPVDSTGRQGERQEEYSVLDTGSLLCFEDGKVLGLVFETFGSIHNPMYSIRFASAASIDRELTQKGNAVFYLPSQSTYVLTQLLRSIKGSDASNMWDEEVADDEIDYSDDEQEAEAKRRAKATRYGKVDEQGNPLPAPSARGNKRQKQQGPGQSSQPSSNAHANQRPKQGGAGNAGYVADQRPQGSHAPMSLPRRHIGGPDLPLPPVPSGPASLGPAFPHGIASLPPKPSAGLPSKPKFAAERSSSELATNQQAAALGSRSRTATAESSAGGLTHSRMNSAAASSLPAKPVDAVAAAAAESLASGSTTPKQSTPAMSPYRAPAGGVGVGAPSPPHASRPALMRGVAPTPAAAAYPHQGSPGWYAGAAPAGSSTPASPGAPHQHAAAARGVTYSPGAGAPVTAQGGGHYNPAYAAHWQQHSYGPAATSAPPTHAAAGGHPWNAPYQHHPAPLHMAPGGISHQPPYGGYGGAHGGYGAPNGAAPGAQWAGGQSYPGSHYPGYTDRQYHASAANAHAAAAAHAGHNHYAAPAQTHGYAGYAAQGASADPYNGYVYAPPSAHAAPASNAAASSATQESYDPRSPMMSGQNGQNQHAASGSSQGR
ncbi:related to NAF1-nuclear assembly factor [Sporisorium reilianum f. sp. reilianum]|uniref:H/ACA ribonucleoprotein complex non-core subunit NAF1 n=1 Tax=Sporisorium reilianum f. sp. reilianum TaxID=72559 RepID=A0A2N8UEU3_9BASI|nr:related to NAF1-nuclear assembly factor [Sporisorium reilianum f. sp. reilianum]